MSEQESWTYAKAGVDIAAGNALVKAIGPLARATSRPGANVSQNVTPNAYPQAIGPFERAEAPARAEAQGVPPAAAAEVARTPAAPLSASSVARPRVVMEFPAKADDILLSGLLTGGEALTRKALVVDVSVGKGHIVLYALRPFWRSQTQGSYFLGYNAILHWNNLNTGTPAGQSK